VWDDVDQERVEPGGSGTPRRGGVGDRHSPVADPGCRHTAATIGTIWSSSPCAMSVGTSMASRSSVVSVSEKASMQS
jgi:hypothetical protein